MALKVWGLAVVRDAITVPDFLTNLIAGSASGDTVNGFGGDISIPGGAYACDDSDYDLSFAREDVESSVGVLASVLEKRQIEKLTITLLPFGQYLTGSSNGVQWMLVPPAPMTVITLSGSTNPLYDGTWNFATGAKIKSKKAGVAMMTWNLERYDGAALEQATGD